MIRNVFLIYFTKSGSHNIQPPLDLFLLWERENEASPSLICQWLQAGNKPTMPYPSRALPLVPIPIPRVPHHSGVPLHPDTSLSWANANAKFISFCLTMTECRIRRKDMKSTILKIKRTVYLQHFVSWRISVHDTCWFLSFCLPTHSHWRLKLSWGEAFVLVSVLGVSVLELSSSSPLRH